MDDSSPLRRLLCKPSVVPHCVIAPEKVVASNGSGRKGPSRKVRMPWVGGYCGGDGERCRSCVRSNLLTILTMTSVLAGIGLGLGLRTRSKPWTDREIMYVTFPGDLFLRMLKCLILPLIVSSMVSALSGLDLRLSGRIGMRAIVYYMGTTFSAVVLGIILVSAIHPGSGNPDEIARAGDARNVTTVDTLLDLVRNMFPPNIVEACISQYRTALIYPETVPSTASDFNLTDEWLRNDDNATSNVSRAHLPDPNDLYTWKIKGENTEGTNILGVVVFSILLGIAIGHMGDKGKPLVDFFRALGETMMLITGWVIWLSPIGILFLVCGKMLEMSTFEVIIGQLGKYFLTVMLGLFLHGIVVIPLIYAIVTRSLPFRFVFNLFEALITAFGTASSSATIPITVRCLEDKNGVDRRVARFVIPIGATINMDGTALYEAVAAIFIAQVRRVPLDAGKIIAVSITSTAASIGAAGIPQAGLVTMVMVLNAVGLPAEDVTLIIIVDWILDRFRTLINVLGDSVGAGVVNHLSMPELRNRPDPELELQPEQPDDKHVNGEANEIVKSQSTAM